VGFAFLIAWISFRTVNVLTTDLPWRIAPRLHEVKEAIYAFLLALMTIVYFYRNQKVIPKGSEGDVHKIIKFTY